MRTSLANISSNYVNRAFTVLVVVGSVFIVLLVVDPVPIELVVATIVLRLVGYVAIVW